MREDAVGEAPRKRSQGRRNRHSSGFGPVRQVGVAVSIGTPLLVVGVLMLSTLLISLVGIGTFLWILTGAVVVLGVLAAASGRVI
jgi:hypothetical protein